tara:strand:+ start:250 stop:927 length:678 start_codon:yes stop_codon:yes gene_type:complete
MAGVTVQTAETEYAVTTTELKNHLKIDNSDDDAELTVIQKAVHNWAKRTTGRSITTQTLNMFIDSVYQPDIVIKEGAYIGIDQDINRRSIILPESPVASITHVKYYDDDDTATTYAATKYYLDNAAVPAKFVLRQGESYPTGLRVANALEIRYVAGYGASSAVPQDIKLACLSYAANLYEHRGDTLDGKPIVAPPTAVQLIRPYVIHQFSTHPYRGTAHFGGLYG